MGDEVNYIPDGPQRKEVVRLASRLQDTARGLGLERGLRTTPGLAAADLDPAEGR